MKTILAALSAAALVAGSTHAPKPQLMQSTPPPKTVTFAWDAPPTNDLPAAIAGYNFYQLAPATNVLLGTTSNLTFTVFNVVMTATNTFAVTSVDAFANESLFSAAVIVTLPPAPLNLRVTIAH